MHELSRDARARRPSGRPASGRWQQERDQSGGQHLRRLSVTWWPGLTPRGGWLRSSGAPWPARPSRRRGRASGRRPDGNDAAGNAPRRRRTPGRFVCSASRAASRATSCSRRLVRNSPIRPSRSATCSRRLSRSLVRTPTSPRSSPISARCPATTIPVLLRRSESASTTSALRCRSVRSASPCRRSATSIRWACRRRAAASSTPGERAGQDAGGDGHDDPDPHEPDRPGRCGQREDAADHEDDLGGPVQAGRPAPVGQRGRRARWTSQRAWADPRAESRVPLGATRERRTRRALLFEPPPFALLVLVERDLAGPLEQQPGDRQPEPADDRHQRADDPLPRPLRVEAADEG